MKYKATIYSLDDKLIATIEILDSDAAIKIIKMLASKKFKIEISEV